MCVTFDEYKTGNTKEKQNRNVHEVLAKDLLFHFPEFSKHFTLLYETSGRNHVHGSNRIGHKHGLTGSVRNCVHSLASCSSIGILTHFDHRCSCTLILVGVILLNEEHGIVLIFTLVLSISWQFFHRLRSVQPEGGSDCTRILPKCRASLAARQAASPAHRCQI